MFELYFFAQFFPLGESPDGFGVEGDLRGAVAETVVDVKIRVLTGEVAI